MSSRGFYINEGSKRRVIDDRQASELLDHLLAALGRRQALRRVLLVPPDITRLHTGAGELAVMLYEKLRERAEVSVMPALGTHLPMTAQEQRRMYPGIPAERFLVHRYRTDVVSVGTVPASLSEGLTDGAVAKPIDCRVNRILLEPWDRIISIGQLVPHELAGIANFSKNILIGLGGEDTIATSHYVAAIYGLERLMGEVESPMRTLLRYMEKHCIGSLPITYLMTVRGVESGCAVTRGLFAGDDERAYLAGANLCREVSITRLAKPAPTVVATMDAEEYHTAWVANKGIFRTRRAVADGGKLVLYAPGVRQFGEDPENDALLRRIGYRSTREMVRLVNEDESVARNLTTVSHIMVSSPEGRFDLEYAPGGLSREETEATGLPYRSPAQIEERYLRNVAGDGWYESKDGEPYYLVTRPASGLWLAE